MTTPRMRMFAGPNGSGKTTLAQWLSTDYAVNLYHYVNADLLYAEVMRSHRTACPMALDNSKLLNHVLASSYPAPQKAFFQNGKIRLENEFVVFAPEAINSYSVALLADFYRAEYLRKGASFSFETVFSHPAKIQTLRQAKELGYRTYMYFVATNEPKVNLARVTMRNVARPLLAENPLYRVRLFADKSFDYRIKNERYVVF